MTVLLNALVATGYSHAINNMFKVLRSDSNKIKEARQDLNVRRVSSKSMFKVNELRVENRYLLSKLEENFKLTDTLKKASGKYKDNTFLNLVQEITKLNETAFKDMIEHDLIESRLYIKYHDLYEEMNALIRSLNTAICKSMEGDDIDLNIAFMRLTIAAHKTYEKYGLLTNAYFDFIENDSYRFEYRLSPVVIINI